MRNIRALLAGLIVVKHAFKLMAEENEPFITEGVKEQMRHGKVQKKRNLKTPWYLILLMLITSLLSVVLTLAVERTGPRSSSIPSLKVPFCKNGQVPRRSLN